MAKTRQKHQIMNTESKPKEEFIKKRHKREIQITFIIKVQNKTKTKR